MEDRQITVPSSTNLMQRLNAEMASSIDVGNAIKRVMDNSNMSRESQRNGVSSRESQQNRVSSNESQRMPLNSIEYQNILQKLLGICQSKLISHFFSFLFKHFSRF